MNAFSFRTCLTAALIGLGLAATAPAGDGTVNIPRTFADLSGRADNAPVLATGSSTARTLAARHADWVNARDYGVKGDGATDDAVKINTLFAALPNGSEVYFPSGTYVCSDTITLAGKLNVTVRGAGAGTRFTFSGTRTDGLRVVDCTLCTIRDASLSGPATVTNGLTVTATTSSQHVTLNRIYSQGFTNAFATSPDDDQDVSELHHYNCTGSFAAGYGFTLGNGTVGNVENIYYHGCTVRNNAGGGVFCNGSNFVWRGGSADANEGTGDFNIAAAASSPIVIADFQSQSSQRLLTCTAGWGGGTVTLSGITVLDWIDPKAINYGSAIPLHVDGVSFVQGRAGPVSLTLGYDPERPLKASFENCIFDTANPWGNTGAHLDLTYDSCVVTVAGSPATTVMSNVAKTDRGVNFSSYLGLGALTDAAAPNGSIFFGSDHGGALCQKDAVGTVHVGLGGGPVGTGANSFTGTQSTTGNLVANSANVKAQLGWTGVAGQEIYAGLWLGNVVPDLNNYTILAAGAQSILNAPSGGLVDLRVNNSPVISATPAAVTTTAAAATWSGTGTFSGVLKANTQDVPVTIGDGGGAGNNPGIWFLPNPDYTNFAFLATGPAQTTTRVNAPGGGMVEFAIANDPKARFSTNGTALDLGGHGVTFAGHSVSYAAAAPTAGTWNIADVVYNTAPAGGGSVGWVCVTAGSPGVWKTFGTIAN